MKRKLTLEDIDYSIHSWMYLVFAMFSYILYHLEEENYWIFASVIIMIIFIIGIFKETNRLRKLKK